MSKSTKVDKEDDLQTTMLRLAEPNVSSQDLLKAIKKQHPKASKKDIIHAAFSSLISVAGTDDGKAARLHDAAMTERQGGLGE
ncbi:hypothetical protein ABIB57_005097 [Devosia sp. UYZn731]|uniref:hypothetical protein n=1 Tax=Devosia sp. UYZn731 TaxID=3156345 RepID=UPI0033974905